MFRILVTEDLSLEAMKRLAAPDARAAERGITVTQAKGMPLVDYPNLLSCRVAWEGGEGLIAGTLFADEEARIVQLNGFRLDGLPNGTVLVMSNDDIPGVIGRVGTLLGAGRINIAEWRLGCDRSGARCRSSTWTIR